MGMYGGLHGWGLIVFAVIFVIPLWKILTKAGFHGAWSLVVLIPVINIVALWVFAFSDWPKERGDA